MITPDEEVRVIALPREYVYSLTPKGDAALDTSLRARAVADEARGLAQQRRNQRIDGTSPT